MKKLINQKVNVIAEFGQDLSDIRPSQFRWEDHEFKVKEAQRATYRYGGHTSYLFSGTDGQTNFELDFNPADFSWVLTKIWNSIT